MLIFSTSLLLIFLGAITQNSNFALWGVKPNLVLAVIVAFSLIDKDWLKRSVAALLGAALLILEPSLGFETLFLLSILFLAMILVDILPWQPLLNGLAALIICVLTISINGFQLNVFLTELILDVAITGVVLALFNSWKVKRI